MLKPPLSGDRFTENAVDWAGYAGPSEALKKWWAAPIAHNRVFAHYAITEYRPDKWNPGDYARRTVEKAKAELESTASAEEARNPPDR